MCVQIHSNICIWAVYTTIWGGRLHFQPPKKECPPLPGAVRRMRCFRVAPEATGGPARRLAVTFDSVTLALGRGGPEGTAMAAAPPPLGPPHSPPTTQSTPPPSRRSLVLKNDGTTTKIIMFSGHIFSSKTVGIQVSKEHSSAMHSFFWAGYSRERIFSGVSVFFSMFELLCLYPESVLMSCPRGTCLLGGTVVTQGTPSVLRSVVGGGPNPPQSVTFFVFLRSDCGKFRTPHLLGRFKKTVKKMSHCALENAKIGFFFRILKLIAHLFPLAKIIKNSKNIFEL